MSDDEDLVVDASAFVDFLLGDRAVGEQLRDRSLHAPAHLDAEVLSALGRLVRAGRLQPDEAEQRLDAIVESPVQRHRLAGLLRGAWRRRHNLRLVDALYVELATQLRHRLLTTDGRLARSTHIAELPTPLTSE